MIENIKELLQSDEIVNIQLAKIIADSNNLPISEFRQIVEQQITKSLRSNNIELLCELANSFNCVDYFNTKYGKYWQLIENATTLEMINHSCSSNNLALYSSSQSGEFRPILENDFFDFIQKRLWIKGYTVTQSTIDLLSEANKNGLFYIRFEDCDLSQVTNFDFENVTYFGMKNVEIDENYSAKFKKLKFLDLNNCSLSKIPSWLENCEKLEKIDFSKNSLTDISIDFSKFQKLENFDLTFNQIKNIPKSLEDLPNLKSVKLYGHKIPKKRLNELKTNLVIQVLKFR